MKNKFKLTSQTEEDITRELKEMMELESFKDIEDLLDSEMDMESHENLEYISESGKKYTSTNLSEEQETIFQECILSKINEEKIHGQDILDYFDFETDTCAKFIESFERFDWFDYTMGYDILDLLDVLLESFMELYTEAMEKHLNTDLLYGQDEDDVV